MTRRSDPFYLVFFVVLVSCVSTTRDKEATLQNSNMENIKLITLDPGHFHAALVQKNSYEKLSDTVEVFAPDGPDLRQHLSRIEAYNSRLENPTRWMEKVYAGPDFFAKMVADASGNVVVISGNNARKTEYILESLESGFHVLADKPMVIEPEEFDLLIKAFAKAEESGLLLYDIMTERFEITTMLQKEFSLRPAIFGSLEQGTPEDPAVTKESIHHFFKYVSGTPLIRPAWFFDVSMQGEGLVDVSTHLVDLIQWECFPERIIDYKNDVELLSARRWATELSPRQFQRVTGMSQYGSSLEKYLTEDSILQVFSNGEINFKINGIHARTSVTWNYEAPAGAGDSHFSMMRGTKANLVIRQGKEENYETTLYIEPKTDDPDSFDQLLSTELASLQGRYPGIYIEKKGDARVIQIPGELRLGHEAHFGQVMTRFLAYLNSGLPTWEVPNMISRYFITTEALKMSRSR